MEKSYGVAIEPPTSKTFGLNQHPACIELNVKDGIVLVGSDSHYWPGIITTAHKAFVAFAERFQPVAVIKNGDVMDFPSISRFDPSSWTDLESRPSVADEIDTAQQRMNEIRKAAPNAKLCWPLGNHDARLETRIVSNAPQLAKVHGTRLKDHFEHWQPCWAVKVNGDTIIKHRWKGGMYATRNNTLMAGINMITGHLHSLKVWPHSDYRGVRFGMDCGTLAEPYGPQFANYTELNPVDWRSGFGMLTFKNGELLWPEIVHVRKPGEVEFRGDTFTI